MEMSQNWLKIESWPSDKIGYQKGKEVFKMTKNTLFSKMFAISGSFDEKP